ncbi:hypothetical protein BG006_010717 [Podila minutissima]|uniref:Uncharacterized protein n=1 Tax=Podila minutissima TaxID=64525 RepID=A0A9P5VIK3_9FUNG|nr:hypothetical protein BG006_010717 [Podila minutissima]
MYRASEHVSPVSSSLSPGDQSKAGDGGGGGGKKKKQVKKPVEAVGYLQLHRFASKKDRLFVMLGIICSLVWCSCAPGPLIGAATAFMAKYTVESSSGEGKGPFPKQAQWSSKAFSSIRTVVTLRGQKRETKAYLKHLDDAYATGSKKAVITGIGYI